MGTATPPSTRQRFLDDIADYNLRETLQAACVVRRITRPLLHALVEASAAAPLYEQLQALPFIGESREGLVVHDAVREAVAAELQAPHPAPHRRFPRPAWAQPSLYKPPAPPAH